MYLNMLQINELIQGGDPIPALTNNPICKGDKAMDKSILPEESLIGKRRIFQTNDLIGKKYGMWTVLGDPTESYRQRKLKVKCECGTIRDVDFTSLNSGRSTNCGCTRNCQYHGLTGTSVYSRWKSMRNRCYCKGGSSYQNYGGRGIKICEEWNNSPRAFCRWALENGWREGLLIDRIDVDGDYSPSNCRFIEKVVSNRNTQLLPKHNTSGYRGVCFHKNDKKWNAQIKYNSKIIYIGSFSSPIEAARAYDAKAKELDSSYPLNFSN